MGDDVTDAPRKGGCLRCGCLGCMGLVLLAVLAAVGGLAWGWFQRPGDPRVETQSYTHVAPAAAGAPALVPSPAPDKVAVTVYRSSCAQCEMQLQWLNGFAMVRETRHVSLPAGESELRFEGVAGGIVPQSAIVEGLGDVVEKNRDAKLLSPGTLLDSFLGRRLHLRRTSQATTAW